MKTQVAAVITAAGAMAYLALLGSAMFCAMVALLIVRRHIPGREALLRRGRDQSSPGVLPPQGMSQQRSS